MFINLKIFFLSIILFVAHEGYSCSRIFYNKAPGKTVVSRSLDWHEPMGDVLKIYPRGLQSNGLTESNPAEWTSRYGSLVLEGKHYRNGGIEGVNEKGLAAHILYLEGTDYGQRDDRPGVSYLAWARYLLDNFATVEEAVAGLHKIQIVGTEIGGKTLPLHLALEDAGGDAAIVEIIDGKYVVHHSPEHVVLTNEPAYSWQLLNLRKYVPFGGQEPIPENTQTLDRFVRAMLHLKQVSEPQSETDRVALAFDLISKVSVKDTWWTSVIDLSQKKYYYRSKTPKLVWIDLNRIDFSNTIRTIDLEDESVAGDISEHLI